MKGPLRIIVSEETNSPAKRLRLLCLAVALAACASGCIVIPTPEFDSGQARANIKEETPSQFQIGKTTRADLILALGEPDAISPDELMLAYRSEKIRAYGCAGGGYGGGCGPIMKQLYLVAKFDEEGVLQKLDHSSQWLTLSDPGKMLPAATVTGFATTTNVKLPVRSQKPAFWLKGIDAFGSKSISRPAGAEYYPGQLLLTDTELQFILNTALANTRPVLILPLDAITEVRMDKFALAQWLVVRIQSGEVHSFMSFFVSDREDLTSSAEFLQSRIKH